MTSPGIGDNSAHKVVASELRSFAERIENQIEERRTINENIKDIKTEAASKGYDKKVLMALVKHRAADKAELEEFQALLDMYIANAG